MATVEVTNANNYHISRRH